MGQGGSLVVAVAIFFFFFFFSKRKPPYEFPAFLLGSEIVIRARFISVVEMAFILFFFSLFLVQIKFLKLLGA